MKLIKGSRTLRRFEVDTEITDLGDIQKCLNSGAFQNPKDNNAIARQHGVVTARDILSTDFDVFENWGYNNFVFGQFRIDQKKIPKHLVTAKLAEAEQEWLASKGREKMFKKDREDLKERVILQIAEKVLPKITTAEFCWNREEGYVVLFSTTKATCELFKQWFEDIFEATLTEFTPMMYLDAEDTRVTNLTFGRENEEADLRTDVYPKVHSDFLTWLLYLSDVTGVGGSNMFQYKDDKAVEVLTLDRIAFSDPDTKKKVNISGENAATMEAAKTCLTLHGNRLTELKIGIRTLKSGYFEFTLNGEYLDVKSLKVLGIEYDDDGGDPEVKNQKSGLEDFGGSLLLRMDEYETLFGILQMLFGKFADTRVDTEGYREIENEIRDWGYGG